MKRISFFFQSSETGPKQKIEAEFSKEELNQLEGYLLQIADLKKTKLIRDKFQASFNLKWKKEWDGFRVDTQLPDEDDLLALLHRLRPFILKKEYASFEKVSGLLRKKFNHEVFRSFMKWYRLMYQGKHIENTMRITSGDIIVNSEKTMMDWLNSHEYHRDQETKEKLAPIFKTFSHDGARAIFVMILLDKVKAILCIGELIKLALGRDSVDSIYFNPTPIKDAT